MSYLSGVLRAMGVPMKSDGSDADVATAGSVTPADWVYDQGTGTLARGAVCYADGPAAAGIFRGPRSPIPNSGVVGEVYPGNYAGHGAGLNTPSMDGVGGKRPAPSGPLPAGRYDIGPIGRQIIGRGTGKPHPLSDAMRLTPWPGTDMKGRAGFLFHGGDMSGRGSSEGCIVTPPKVRRDIGGSGDSVLWVVPGPGAS